MSMVPSAEQKSQYDLVPAALPALKPSHHISSKVRSLEMVAARRRIGQWANNMADAEYNCEAAAARWQARLATVWRATSADPDPQNNLRTAVCCDIWTEFALLGKDKTTAKGGESTEQRRLSAFVQRSLRVLLHSVYSNLDSRRPSNEEQKSPPTAAAASTVASGLASAESLAPIPHFDVVRDYHRRLASLRDVMAREQQQIATMTKTMMRRNDIVVSTIQVRLSPPLPARASTPFTPGAPRVHPARGLP
jgi:hypothetical protein